MGASLMDSNQFMIYLLYKFGLTNWIRLFYLYSLSVSYLFYASI